MTKKKQAIRILRSLVKRRKIWTTAILAQATKAASKLWILLKLAQGNLAAKIKS